MAVLRGFVFIIPTLFNINDRFDIVIEIVYRT